MRTVFLILIKSISKKAFKERFIATLLCFLVFMPVKAFCGGAAPYTEEANKKLNAAFTRMYKTTHEKDITSEEYQREKIELMRKIFDEVGYSYDATIVKIVEDLQYHPERIPDDIRKDPDSMVPHGVVGILHFIMSDCEYYNVDCLKFFPPDTAEAVKTLMEIAEFGP